MPKSKEDYMAKHKTKLTHKEQAHSAQAKPVKSGGAAAASSQNAKKQ